MRQSQCPVKGTPQSLRFRGLFRFLRVVGCLRTQRMNAASSGARRSSSMLGYATASVRLVYVAWTMPWHCEQIIDTSSLVPPFDFGRQWCFVRSDFENPRPHSPQGVRLMSLMAPE
jgi:hypothetical protein